VDTHLLAVKPVSERLFKTIARDSKAALIWRRLKVRKLRPPSRLLPDFRAVTGWDV